jgi:hypothetical protein
MLPIGIDIHATCSGSEAHRFYTTHHDNAGGDLVDDVGILQVTGDA